MFYRCLAVCRPFTYHKIVTTRRAVWVIVGIWVVCTLVALPPVELSFIPGYTSWGDIGWSRFVTMATTLLISYVRKTVLTVQSSAKYFTLCEEDCSIFCQILYIFESFFKILTKKRKRNKGSSKHFIPCCRYTFSCAMKQKSGYPLFYFFFTLFLPVLVAIISYTLIFAAAAKSVS